MELINECSMRFAEDKDFRLLVRELVTFYSICQKSFLDRRQYYGSLPCRLFWSRRTQRTSTKGETHHHVECFHFIRTLHAARAGIYFCPFDCAIIIDGTCQMLSKLTKLSEEYNVLTIFSSYMYV